MFPLITYRHVSFIAVILLFGITGDIYGMMRKETTCAIFKYLVLGQAKNNSLLGNCNAHIYNYYRYGHFNFERFSGLPEMIPKISRNCNAETIADRQSQTC